MSKGKRNRNKHPERKAKRPESDSRSPSTFDILFPAVLATLVSAALLLQLTSPRSMLSVIRRVEGMALDVRNSHSSGLSRGTTWDDLFRTRDTAIRRHPDMPEHFALASLLRLYAETQRGSWDSREAVEKARDDALQAPDNLIARLVYADLKDRAHQVVASENGAGSAVLARFETFRAIVEGDRPVAHVTLFNAECTNIWFGVVQRYMQRRPDVAVSITPAVYHYRIAEHFEVLPVLVRRIATLAADLRASGHEDAANHCIRWIAQAGFGLIDADPDAGTRLLCSDVLLTVLDEESEAAQRLRDLRRDYHHHAEAAPVDLADQSFVLRPATIPETYDAALRLLLVAVIFALVAGGAGVMLLIVG
ncbi:MAG: hypothetical protein K8S14_02410, partial [Actinomycetia bacterium]|nr:hypothetical protein [Actinomycetes bacterium]